MPNPVAANDLQPISGSLQTSRISYGVETAGKNYGQNYNSTTWYSDIPNNGQFYTIISDNYTANYYVSRSNAGGAYVEGGLPAVDEYSAPVFWVTVGTSSLDVITIVNGLPDRIGQTPFNSGSQALNWVASSSNYFAVGPDYYAQIDADNLSFYIDGNQIISYPTTGSKWYDLSGIGSINMNLYNGPTYNNNGWITFDGSDDYGEADALITPATGAFSVEFLYRIDSSGGRGGLFERNEASPFNGMSLGQGGPGIWNFYVTNNSSVSSLQADWTYPTLGRWYHDIGTYNGSNNVKAYRNGIEVDSTTGTTQTNLDTSGTREPLRIFSRDASSSRISGSVAAVRIYPKELSAAEVAQNYYGGPIVTDSLSFMFDAGNLVSYPKSGTTVYTLTGSVNGTLTNGVGYNNIYGGTFNFDGVDDYINLGQINYTSVTVEGWVFRDDTTDLVNIVSGAGVVQYFSVYSQTLAYYASTNTGTWTFGTTTLQPQTWYHVALTYDDSNYSVKMYLNGNLESTSTADASYRTGYVSTLGTYANASIRFWKGYISNLRVYNTALTQAQVLQNYNATK
jgi:hypothetical protein